MQVLNGTGPGVRRSKRPLLASRTRCNVPWKPPKFGSKVKIGIKVQFGNKFANRCNVIVCVPHFYDLSDLVGFWSSVSIRWIIYKFLNVCPFDYTAFVVGGKG